jgi:ABC-type uncharacterized transport system auxiliary subunit
MRTVYILEAAWHDSIGRVRQNKIVGVYENLDKIDKAKNFILNQPTQYKSISFNINQEIQPFENI